MLETPQRVLDLKDTLVLGIQDLVNKNPPLRKLDLFDVEISKNDSGEMVITASPTPELRKKLDGTMGQMWTSDSASNQESWAIMRFLAIHTVDDVLVEGQTSPFINADVKGYSIHSEKSLKPVGEGKTNLSISLVLNEEKPYITGENRPPFSTPLMEIVKDWIENGKDKLELFLVENLYIGNEPVRTTSIHLPHALLALLSYKGVSLKDLDIYDKVLELALNHFLEAITNSPISIRTPENERVKETTIPTIFRGVVLKRKPHEKTPRYTEFSLVRSETS